MILSWMRCLRVHTNGSIGSLSHPWRRCDMWLSSRGWVYTVEISSIPLGYRNSRCVRSYTKDVFLLGNWRPLYKWCTLCFVHPRTVTNTENSSSKYCNKKRRNSVRTSVTRQSKKALNWGEQLFWCVRVWSGGWVHLHSCLTCEKINCTNENGADCSGCAKTLPN